MPPTKFSKIACSIAAHYLKWVGHLQELRRNDTSLFPGFGQKSGSDPNWATEKLVGLSEDIMSYCSKATEQPAKFYTNQTYSCSMDAEQPAKF